MALGIKTESEGGDFLPIVKYDARAGRMFRVDRSQAPDGSWQKDDVDITDKASFVMDLENIEVGWINFETTPEFRLVPLGQPLPPKPGDKFRQGFRTRIKLAKSIGGDVREFSHTAKAVLGAVDALHDAYVAAPESRAGKLPVVKLAGTTPIKTKTPQGTTTNYAPVLEIVQWVDRPEDMAVNGKAERAQTAPAGNGANGAVHVPPPPPAATAPATEDAPEF